MDDWGLKDKVALVTGSTRGLDRAIAKKLAEEKAKVIITGTNQEQAKAIAESMQQPNWWSLSCRSGNDKNLFGG